jgi:hypothetical protein
MATFQVQVEDMVGTVETTVGSGSSDTTAITSWLTDGAKEVINAMPPNLLILCAAEATAFTPQAPGSESSASVLNTGKVFNVRRNDGTIDQPCRMILSNVKGRASDPHDMDYATATDPVYYLESNNLNILPSASSAVGKYSEVQYPAVAYGDSSIAVFPDEAEYLVVLYAAMKAVERISANYNVDEDPEMAASRQAHYSWLVEQYSKGLQILRGQ